MNLRLESGPPIKRAARTSKKLKAMIEAQIVTIKVAKALTNVPFRY